MVADAPATTVSALPQSRRDTSTTTTAAPHKKLVPFDVGEKVKKNKRDLTDITKIMRFTKKFIWFKWIEGATLFFLHTSGRIERVH